MKKPFIQRAVYLSRIGFERAAPRPSIPAQLCDLGRGLYCDGASCKQTAAVGEACAPTSLCDVATAYCDTSLTPSSCVARRPLGATCSGSSSAICASGTYCDGATCRTPGELESVCSNDLLADPAQCHSGFCDRGHCGIPVLALCGF